METYLQDLMNTQCAAGLEVCALVHQSETSMRDRIDKVPTPSGKSYEVVRAARWFNLGFVPVSPFFVSSAAALIARFEPDVIHIHHPNASPVGLLLLPSAQRVSWVSQWHADILTPMANRLVRLAYALYRPMEQAVLRRSSTILATSAAYFECSHALASHQQRVKVLPLGLDQTRLPASDEVNPLPRDKMPLVLSVGRLCGYKGFDTLIEAVRLVPELQCWIVGDGPDKSKLQALIKRHQLQERVRLLGALNNIELWRAYKTCDVFVLPSFDKTEAFGMVLLEAMQFAKPIVVCDIKGSGVPWVAKLADRSTIVPVKDPGALARAITAHLKNGQQHSKPTPTPTTLNLITQVKDLCGVYEQARSDYTLQ